MQKVKFAKFDETVELSVRLGVDPKHADQMVRGTVVLPHGLGKSKKVLVIASADKQKEAQEAGADEVGGDEVVEKILGGWMDFEAVVATPDMMRGVGRLGKVLGPRGLMPNPKTGTVTTDIAKAVKEIKAGKVEFRVDKTGIVHAPVGKTSFAQDALIANAQALVDSIVKAKPPAAKGRYLKSITVSSTMGPGVRIDTTSVEAVQALGRGRIKSNGCHTSNQGSAAGSADPGVLRGRNRDPGGLQGAQRPAGHRTAPAAARRQGAVQGRQEHAGQARPQRARRSSRSASTSRARRRWPTRPTTRWRWPRR